MLARSNNWIDGNDSRVLLSYWVRSSKTRVHLVPGGLSSSRTIVFKFWYLHKLTVDQPPPPFTLYVGIGVRSTRYDHLRSPEWFAPTPYAKTIKKSLEQDLESDLDNELHGRIEQSKYIIHIYNTYFPRWSVNPFAERYYWVAV